MRNTQLVRHDSENEFDVDEPDEIIQDNHSDDDWTPEKSTGRRQSRRLRGSPRPALTEMSSSDEFTDEEFDSDYERKGGRRGRGRSGKRGKRSNTGSVTKRARVSSTTHEATVNSDSQGANDESKGSGSNSDSEPSSTTLTGRDLKHYSSGSFVLLKSDLKDDTDYPFLWKIDGKSLLQKYVSFEMKGETVYRNTSVYSGWSIGNKNQYYPVKVEFVQQQKKEHIVRFNKDMIIKDSENEELEGNENETNENETNENENEKENEEEEEEEEDEEEEDEEEDGEGEEGEEEDEDEAEANGKKNEDEEDSNSVMEKE